MKAWTTPGQFKWLSERIPLWHSKPKRKTSQFVASTTTEFLKEFPAERGDLTKVRKVSVSLVPPSFKHLYAVLED